ncbi:acetyl esterase/lipase [Nocardia tenerifensis]|uniref:Acetyl esterase/lipase n=1 Tax=Nocardia tenerifensis TaxID=228006 RepID=A0A318K789_9NOCA|nr:alpha/beta hydrolase [Nocardia tenerifensis]PXX68544.1 acetyl esterase/lipase [Nocardia tenerifensis]
MVLRWLVAASAAVVAVLMVLFAYVIVAVRVPAPFVLLTHVVSDYGLYLIPLGLVGFALSLIAFGRKGRPGVRWVASASGLVCLLGVVAAGFPLAAAWGTAVRQEASLSLGEYLSGDTNTAAPVESPGTVYNTVDGQDLKLDVKLPEGAPVRPRPAVVWVHGGGWRNGDRGEAPQWHKWLIDKGYAVFAIDYRMVPPARWRQSPADVKCAVGWVKQQAATYGVDPDRVLLAGGSAGGNLALMGAYADDRVPPSCAVADTSVNAVAAFYPVPDLAEAWRDTGLPERMRTFLADYTGGTPDQVPDRYRAASPATYVRPNLPPTLLMHGDRDHVAPYRGSAELAERLRRVGVENRLLTVPYGEHIYDFTWTGWGTQISRQVFDRFLADHFPAP